MPSPSPRYTVRFPEPLNAQVQEHLRSTGLPFSILIRDALAAYLADRVPTPRVPTGADIGADTVPTQADKVPTGADTLRQLEERLSALTTRVERLEQVPTRRRQPTARRADTGADTGADTPAARADRVPTDADRAPARYDPAAAAARIRELQRQGLTLTEIALQLEREGIHTRYGKPWQKSSMLYLLKQYGA